MKRNWKVLSILLVLAMLLVGCTGQTQPSNNESNSGNDNGGSAANTSDNQTDTKPQEKIIRMSVAGTPKVDPATGADGGSCIAMVNFYDSLVYPGFDGTVAPSLAESWEISDDNLVYTFKLKEGVKFHDGSELKSSDVVFSINRLLGIGEGNAYLFQDYIKEAVALDDYTVQISLFKSFGPFLATLPRIYIVSEKTIMDNIDKSGPYGEFGDYGKNYLLTHDAGSGAYQVTDVQQQGYVLAERFEDYWRNWDNTDAPDTIKLIDNTEASTVRTLIGNRELEIADEWQSTENINAMMKIPDVSICTFSKCAVQNYMYNTKIAPTDDVNFRKALNCLFDYKTISEKILVDSPQSIGPVPATIPGANPDLMQYSYDLDKAKEYLSKSKYADSLEQYPIELTIISDVADAEKIALGFQSAAQQVGLTVNVSKAPWLSVQEQVASVETTPNMISISVPANYFEAGAILSSRYHSSSTGTWEQAEWLQNDEIDKMIEDALATVDKDERFDKYYKIQEKLVELAPTAWLVDNVQRHIYQSKYVYWPIAEETKKGNIVSLPTGYPFDFKDFKIIQN